MICEEQARVLLLVLLSVQLNLCANVLSLILFSVKTSNIESAGEDLLGIVFCRRVCSEDFEPLENLLWQKFRFNERKVNVICSGGKTILGMMGIYHL